MARGKDLPDAQQRQEKAEAEALDREIVDIILVLDESIESLADLLRAHRGGARHAAG